MGQAAAPPVPPPSARRRWSANSPWHHPPRRCELLLPRRLRHCRSSLPYPRVLTLLAPCDNARSANRPRRASRLLKIRSALTSGRKTIINVVMIVNVVCCFSPNPPKDTEGRREDSGRGVRELQGRWPGLHWGRWEVGGRSSVAGTGSLWPSAGAAMRGMAKRIRSRERSRTGVARVCGDVGSVAGWPSGRELEWLAAGPRRE